MKYFVLITALALAGCAHSDPKLPGPAVITEKVEVKVPVPVPCVVIVDRAKLEIDQIEKGQPLEIQNSVLRMTVAQQQDYVTALEALIIGCGGKIN